MIKKKKRLKKLGGVLACTCPERGVVHTLLFIQREVLSTNGADLGRAMVARVVLGLLLLALLWPVQIYSTQTTVVTLSRNSSQNTWAAPNPWKATAKASGGALQSTASLFVALPSLLHLSCEGQDTAVRPHLLNPIQMASRCPVWQGKNRSLWNLLIPHLILLTRKNLRIPNLTGLKSTWRCWLDDKCQY